ncbi:MAG: DUF362 domain-containing protein [Tannerella sp.]|jgi:uncharacterized protein (DUF362 family)|nr:DUF362 domain-containing protein [Tannerella sp.]
MKIHRRDFIRTALWGGVATAAIPSYAMKILAETTKVAVDDNAKVSLATGSGRAEVAFKALQPFSKEIAQAVGNRKIIVKPNMVTSTIQLSAVHKDTIEGILEFYKSINKLENVVVAESVADGPTMKAYDNYGYVPIAEKYKVKLLSLDDTTPQVLYVMDELDLRPKPVRMSSLLTDRNNFVMSVGRMKTHDRVVATLSLKNVVVGAPIKEPGYSWGADRRKEARSDKAIVHGNGFRGINYNLFALAYHIRPDLAFVDGFEGMEGDGPNNGTPVDHKICIAGFDWLAVDRVGLELMGIDPGRVGYLTFCGEAGLGQFNINKIEITGEKLSDHIRTYQLSRNIEKQMQWQTPLRERAEPLY